MFVILQSNPSNDVRDTAKKFVDYDGVMTMAQIRPFWPVGAMITRCVSGICGVNRKEDYQVVAEGPTDRAQIQLPVPVMIRGKFRYGSFMNILLQ
jgi:bacterioferritin-associated ferredoxin